MSKWTDAPSSPMNYKKHLTGAAYLIAQSLTLNLISVPATALIIRRLGATQYGEWAVATALVATTAFLTNLGLREVFLRRVIFYPADVETAVAEQIGLRGMLALLSGAVALVACLLIGYPPIILQCVSIMSVGVVLSTLNSVLVDMMQGTHRVSTVATANFVSGLALTTISVILVLNRPGAIILSLAYLFGPLTSLMFLLGVAQRGGIQIRVAVNFVVFRNLLRQSRVLVFPQMLGSLRDKLESLLVPKLVGVTAFGYFAAGSMPANRLGIFAEGITTSFYSRIAHDGKDQAASATGVTAQLISTVLLVCIPLSMLLFVLAQPVSEILFPKSPDNCKVLMQITCWAITLEGLAQAFSCVIQAVGKFKEVSQATTAAAVVGIVTTIYLIHLFGALGACGALLARYLIMILLLLPNLTRIFPSVLTKVPWMRLFCSAFVMAVVLNLYTIVPGSAWVKMFLVSSLACVCYCLCLILLGVIPRHMLRTLIYQDSIDS